MLQRIGLAQAMLHDPEVLILDEPMSGLDPVGRREVRDLISEISLTGKTIFFSTHIIPDVEVNLLDGGVHRQGGSQGARQYRVAHLARRSNPWRSGSGFPYERDPHAVAGLKTSRRTMDGWVIEIESDANQLEGDVQSVLTTILSAEKGVVKAVIPRKCTLEDLFFGEAGAKRPDGARAPMTGLYRVLKQIFAIAAMVTFHEVIRERVLLEPPSCSACCRSAWPTRFPAAVVHRELAGSRSTSA